MFTVLSVYRILLFHIETIFVVFYYNTRFKDLSWSDWAEIRTRPSLYDYLKKEAFLKILIFAIMAAILNP